MWKRWKFGSGRRASARRVRPCLEMLEDRLCPAILTVTTLSDPSPAAANDGSLRGELLQNQTDGGNDTIIFAAGLNGTINLKAANGPLTNFGKNVTIANPNGDTIAISGQGAIEDLNLTGGAGVLVSINGQSSGGAGSLTITGGVGRSTTINGATVIVGGGIFNSATTTLSNLTVSGNSAATTAASTLGEGGGIFNEAAVLTLNNDVFSGNTASSSTAFAGGGGVYNFMTGQMKVTGGLVENNLVSSGGATVQGGGLFDSSSTGLSISGTVFSDNTATTSANGFTAEGGGIYVNMDPYVVLSNVTVSGNTASFTGTGTGGVKGGGVFSTGNTSAMFTNLNVLGNHASATGTGGFIDGAGLFSEKSTTTFSGNADGNTASDTGAGTVLGGGIFTSATSPLTITAINATTASTISDNSITATAVVNGGGIYASGTSPLNISTATISGNTATSSAGGILGGGICTGAGPLTLTACTITANAISSGPAEAALGGGIFTDGTLTATNDTIWANSATANASSADGGGLLLDPPGKATLINDTVGDNTATGAAGSHGGGIFVSTGAILNMVNTIVYDPTGPSDSPDVHGTIANAQNDLFGSLTGATITNNLGGNITSATPGLGTLANNGGPTLTVSDAGSLAVDAGTSSSAIGTIPGTDQRGAPRPDIAGTNPDIGAFEFQAPPTPTTSSLPTSITGLKVSDTFGLFNQTETVSGQVVDGGIPVSGGQVTISDGGQTQTVGVNSSGGFSATFVFNLFQEFTTAGSHSIGVSFGGATVGSTTFGSSSGNVNAPNNIFSFYFQLLIFEDLLAALGY
jgi:fibronectin-binding autotransporter adhesin